MPNTVNQKHLKQLKNTIKGKTEQPPVGYIPRGAAEWIGCSNLRGLVKKKVNRSEVKKAWKSKNALAAYITTMAWGGMNRKYLKMSLEGESGKKIIGLVERLIDEKPDATEAYRMFYNARKKKEIKGIGISYYTKLIAFANDCQKQFILDQWTAKSINLLFGKNFIPMSGDFPNQTKCTPEIYLKFCEKILWLQSKLNLSSPEQIEISLFSKGGRNKEPWRQYVIENTGWSEPKANKNNEDQEMGFVRDDAINSSAEAIRMIICFIEGRYGIKLEHGGFEVVKNGKTLRYEGQPIGIYNMRAKAGVALRLRSSLSSSDWKKQRKNDRRMSKNYTGGYYGYLDITPDYLWNNGEAVGQWIEESLREQGLIT